MTSWHSATAILPCSEGHSTTHKQYKGQHTQIYKKKTTATQLTTTTKIYYYRSILIKWRELRYIHNSVD